MVLDDCLMRTEKYNSASRIMCPEQIILDVFLRFLLTILRNDDAPVGFQRNFHTGYTGKKFV